MEKRSVIGVVTIAVLANLVLTFDPSIQSSPLSHVGKSLGLEQEQPTISHKVQSSSNESGQPPVEQNAYTHRVLIPRGVLDDPYDNLTRYTDEGDAIARYKPYNFMPAQVDIFRGDKLVFENKDTISHTATSGINPFNDPDLGQIFDTGAIAPGDITEILTNNFSASNDPYIEEKIHYICTLHPYISLFGDIRVWEPDPLALGNQIHSRFI